MAEPDDENMKQCSTAANTHHAPQEWLSELEIDERRALIFGKLVEERGDYGNSDEGRARLTEVTSRLLARPWLQALALWELGRLNELPGWDWVWALDAYEEEIETSLMGMVEWHLGFQVDDLFDSAHDWMAGALFYSPDSLLGKLSELRTAASTYDINLKDLSRRRQ